MVSGSIKRRFMKKPEADYLLKKTWQSTKNCMAAKFDY
jgi:hypothetical protein